MVPPWAPRPRFVVTVTGVAELSAAAGLILESTARVAATGLAILLVATFPANVHAAREHIGIGGRPPTPLVPRTVMQIVFVAAAAAVAVGGAV
jgi:uncharacterized membrane protein